MALYLDTDVQYIKGVGPKLAQMLAKKGIYKIEDLFEFYPRAYEDRRAARNIASLRDGEIVSIKAQVLGVSSQNLGRSSRKVYTVLVRDDSGKVACKYFRTPYKGYFERFQTGQWVKVVGKVTNYRGTIEFHHPDIQDPVSSEEEDAIVPIYSDIERLSSKKIRSIYDTAFQALQSPIVEKLPDWIRKKYDLVKRHDAVYNLHHPPKGDADSFLRFQTPYQKRVIFEELFWLELLMVAKKKGLKKEQGIALEANYELVDKFRAALPFSLTQAQLKAFAEVATDMQAPHPMHRMVQGDVGCGKTMVALMAALFAKSSGYQSAIMVPTEILAKQHFKNAKENLESLGLKIGLLTGSMGAKAKRETLEAVASGEIDICVGTHALIQKEVEFKNLALVIIDEQHRFGVEQRNQLKKKGIAPHFLLMTATPIPRTLAMTVYGDLDSSIINELPAGRVPILTRVVYESNRHKVMGFLEEQVQSGRQAYIVYPLVEESEKIDLKNATQEFEQLKERYPKINFGLLHGKMKEQEKSEIMESFRKNEIQVLVSTTVIEVGVDVPNANMMIVEHSERFGLSQLHQLRGRVGRGKHKSYCVLMLGNAVGKDSKERCDIMAKHSDGFKIAEADLEIRGPGVFMGTKQSGLPGFTMANLVRDSHILQDARSAAIEILERDPNLDHPEHEEVKKELKKSQGALSLASVG